MTTLKHQDKIERVHNVIDLLEAQNRGIWDDAQVTSAVLMTILSNMPAHKARECFDALVASMEKSLGDHFGSEWET